MKFVANHRTNRTMNICQHLSTPAQILPYQAAILFESYALTYEQLHEQSIAAANQLSLAGLQPGDRVALLLPNVPAFAIWYYGALRRGAIVVSLSTRLAESEVAFAVQDCGATFLVVPQTPKLCEKAPESIKHIFEVSDLGNTCNDRPLEFNTDLPQEIYCATPEEPALILYTSGTTGFPKGATLSHGNVTSNVCAFNHLCEMKPDDVILLTVPLFHCFGQNALLNAGFNAGATLVLQRKFDPQESRRLIAEQNVSQLYGVPAMFQMLNDCCSADDLASVNYCFTAASTMPVTVEARWRETYNMPIHAGYGLTETSPFASYNHRLKFVPGSIGAPIDNVQMKIVDSATKQPVEVGELGEIAIRGPNVMLGYWNRPEDTASVIIDGWFHSGDIGRVDEAGYFYIVDRVKDMISIGGLKVYPAEVERVLLDHAGVAQAAVVGFASSVLGEDVAAFIVRKESDNESGDESFDKTADAALVLDLKDFCRQHLANYKVPKHIFVVDDLPRNPSGKVLKTELRSRQETMLGQISQADHQTTDRSLGQAPQLFQMLKSVYTTERQRTANEYLQNVISTITGDDEKLDVDQRLLESGLDSLMLVELSHQLQVEVGDMADVSATVIFDHPTIGQLSEFLIACLFNESTPSQSSTQSSTENDTQTVSMESNVASMSQDQVLEALLKELEDET